MTAETLAAYEQLCKEKYALESALSEMTAVATLAIKNVPESEFKQQLEAERLKILTILKDGK